MNPLMLPVIEAIDVYHCYTKLVSRDDGAEVYRFDCEQVALFSFNDTAAE